MVEEDVEIDMDWCVVESREHACLADLMEKLERGLGQMPTLRWRNIDTLEEETEGPDDSAQDLEVENEGDIVVECIQTKLFDWDG